MLHRGLRPRSHVTFALFVALTLGVSTTVFAEDAETPLIDEPATTDGDSTEPTSTEPTSTEPASTEEETTDPETDDSPPLRPVLTPDTREVIRTETPTSPALAMSTNGSERSHPSPTTVLDPAIFRSSMVEYTTAWYAGVGFLVGDRRTVVTLGGVRNRLQRITVTPLGAPEPRAMVESVEVAEIGNSTFVVMHLDRELPGRPLELSEGELRINDRVYMFQTLGDRMVRGARRTAFRDRTYTPAEAIVTASSATTITIGMAQEQVWRGSPVFDAEGRVLAFLGRETFAVRHGQIVNAESLQSGRRIAAPIIGFRLGTEFGGGLDDPFAFEFELGASLWDRLGILLRLGFAFGDDVLVHIPASATHGVGIAEGRERSVNLSLEVKYRQLMTRASLPLYIDLVVGVLYSVTILETHGMAIYSTTPSCDPFGELCETSVGQSPGRSTEHGVGPVFGVDVRAGIFTMGYRLALEGASFQLPTTHRITFGATFR